MFICFLVNVMFVMASGVAKVTWGDELFRPREGEEENFMFCFNVFSWFLVVVSGVFLMGFCGC